MGISNLEPRKGRFLLADPALEEVYFHRAVIFLTEHGKEGSVGFVLNKEMDVSLGQAVQDFKGIDFPVYLGGPVGRNNMYYLHTAGSIIPNSLEIKPGIFFGGDYQVLKDLILAGELHNEEVRFFIGYSGWGAGQLEREIAEESWMVMKARLDYLFTGDTEGLWSRILRDMGGDFSMLANFPSDPSLN
jgi:putative transcriptional regulator